MKNPSSALGVGCRIMHNNTQKRGVSGVISSYFFLDDIRLEICSIYRGSWAKLGGSGGG